MKRTIVSLGALALVLALSPAARADDTPSAAPASPAPTEAKPTHSTTSSSHHKSHPLDLNTATKEQLMKLPGVTDATADKIIGARPYTSVSELSSKSILTKDEYGKVKSKVTVKKAA